LQDVGWEEKEQKMIKTSKNPADIEKRWRRGANLTFE